MQIKHAEISPVELNLRQPVRMAGLPEINQVTAIFVRLDTQEGRSAWGCAVAHRQLTGEAPVNAILSCQACADASVDLHPTNIEYSLAQLRQIAEDSPAAVCAFNLAFHDLLGLAAGMPLYRLLGGFRNRIQTSATVPIASVPESVEIARRRARMGFSLLKIKGGMDPDEDVQRVRAIHQALPDLVLRLDADGGYSIESALNVARALKDELEMFEQPTAPEDLGGLREVSKHSKVPVLADQSVTDPESALEVASGRCADGISIKMATCGGFSCARQIDAIAQAAGLATMVSCLVEPALLIAAGLNFALSSSNVRYGDLDGHLDLVQDPTRAGFRMEEGWLIASEVPGLGCTVELG